MGELTVTERITCMIQGSTSCILYIIWKEFQKKKGNTVDSTRHPDDHHHECSLFPLVDNAVCRRELSLKELQSVKGAAQRTKRMSPLFGVAQYRVRMTLTQSLFCRGAHKEWSWRGGGVARQHACLGECSCVICHKHPPRPATQSSPRRRERRRVRSALTQYILQASPGFSPRVKMEWKWMKIEWKWMKIEWKRVKIHPLHGVKRKTTHIQTHSQTHTLKHTLSNTHKNTQRNTHSNTQTQTQWQTHKLFVKLKNSNGMNNI